MTISRRTGPGGSESGGEDGTERGAEALASVTYLPGAYPPGAYPPGAYPPGAYLPGAREGDARRAENVTLHAITRRGQSRAEVADLLRRREIDPHVAEA
jgi:hypothetical protein